MARKKKCSLFLMIVIAMISIVCLRYIAKSGYENFTNIKENFDEIRGGKTCGTCSAT